MQTIDEPPLQSLFMTPKSFEAATLTIASKVPDGTILLVDKQAHTWMCTALAAGVASKCNGAVACIAFPMSLPTSNGTTQRGRNETEGIDASAAEVSLLTEPSNSVYLCCAWIHERNSAQLEAFLTAAQRAGVNVKGTVGVRVEQSASTSWLFRIGPVCACSLARGTGPPWQQQQQSGGGAANALNSNQAHAKTPALRLASRKRPHSPVLVDRSDTHDDKVEVSEIIVVVDEEGSSEQEADNEEEEEDGTARLSQVDDHGDSHDEDECDEDDDVARLSQIDDNVDKINSQHNQLRKLNVGSTAVDPNNVCDDDDADACKDGIPGISMASSGEVMVTKDENQEGGDSLEHPSRGSGASSGTVPAATKAEERFVEAKSGDEAAAAITSAEKLRHGAFSADVDAAAPAADARVLPAVEVEKKVVAAAAAASAALAPPLVKIPTEALQAAGKRDTSPPPPLRSSSCPPSPSPERRRRRERGCAVAARPLSSSLSVAAAVAPPTVAQHSSFEYGANNPSEDRSCSGSVRGLFALVERTHTRKEKRIGKGGCGGDGDGDRLSCCDQCRNEDDDHASDNSGGDGDGDEVDVNADGVAEVFVVADGHGGGLASQFVKDHLLTEIEAELANANATAANRADSADPAAAAAAAVDTVAAAAVAIDTAAATDTSAAAAAAAADDDDDDDDDEGFGITEGGGAGGWRQELVRRALSNAFVSLEKRFLDSLDASWGFADHRTNERHGDGASEDEDDAANKPPTSSLSSSSASLNQKKGGGGVVDTNTNTTTGVCNAGSCVVCVCVLGGWVHTAHVGDCRALLVTATHSSPPTASSPLPASSSSSLSFSLASRSAATAATTTTTQHDVISAAMSAEAAAAVAAAAKLLTTSSESLSVSCNEKKKDEEVDSGSAGDGGQPRDGCLTSLSLSALTSSKRTEKSPWPPRRRSLRSSSDGGNGVACGGGGSERKAAAGGGVSVLSVSGTALTRDHNCYNEVEVALVTKRVAQTADRRQHRRRRTNDDEATTTENLLHVTTEATATATGQPMKHQRTGHVVGAETTKRRRRSSSPPRYSSSSSSSSSLCDVAFTDGAASADAADADASSDTATHALVDLEPIRPSRNDRRQYELKVQRLQRQHLKQLEQKREEQQQRQQQQQRPGNDDEELEGAEKKNAKTKKRDAATVKAPLLRVAGSLAVTRAVGDMYLKHARYANEDLRPHVPYITAVPETSSRKLNLDPSLNPDQPNSSSVSGCCCRCGCRFHHRRHRRRSCDVAVVLASDGLWEVAKNHEVAEWVGAYLSRNFSATFPTNHRVDGGGDSGLQPDPHPPQLTTTTTTATKRPRATTGLTEAAEAHCELAPRRRGGGSGGACTGGGSGAAGVAGTCSQELVLKGLAAVANSQRTTTLDMQRLKFGAERRRMHDDITATVVLLSSAAAVFDPQCTQCHF